MSKVKNNLDWLQKPIFVTGPMKTGTTLLISLLDGHPQLVTYPEEPYFPCFESRLYRTGVERILGWLRSGKNVMHQVNHRLIDERVDGKPLPLDLLVKGVIRGADNDQLSDRFDWSTYNSSLIKHLNHAGFDNKSIIECTIKAFASAYDSPAKSGFARAWAFKFPVNSIPRATEDHFARNHVQSFQSLFPEVRTIVLLRHPLAIVSSRLEHDVSVHGKKYVNQERKQQIQYLATHLSLTFKEYENLFRYQTDANAHFVRFEDLVSNPRESLISVSRFLELDFDENCLFPTKFGIPSDVFTCTTQQKSRVDATIASHWKGKLSDEEIDIVREAFIPRSHWLNRLGYSLNVTDSDLKLPALT